MEEIKIQRTEHPAVKPDENHVILDIETAVSALLEITAEREKRQFVLIGTP